jgi:hypothetical protein
LFITNGKIFDQIGKITVPFRKWFITISERIVASGKRSVLFGKKLVPIYWSFFF